MNQIFVVRAGFAKREPVDAYIIGRLAIHRSLGDEKRWIVTHPESGLSATGSRTFPTKKQASAYAIELQRHIDFSFLELGENGKWDVVAAFGGKIIPAITAAYEAAFGP